MSTTGSRLTRGFAMLTLNTIVNTIGQLSIVPIALHGWGELRFGEWITLTGIVTLFKFTDLGLQTFVVNRITTSYARGDTHEFSAELSKGLSLQLPFIAALFLLSVASFATFPIERWLKVVSLTEMQARFLCILMSAELLISVPFGIVTGVYRATGRLSRGALTGIVQSVVQTLVVSILVWSGSAFSSVIAWRLAATTMVYMWILTDIRRCYPWLRIVFRRVNVNEVFRFLGPSLLFLVFPLADFVANQVGIVILQRHQSGTEVSRLATHRTAVSAAVLIGNLIINTAWPEITRVFAQRQEAVISIQRSLIKFHAWTVGCVTLASLPLLPHVYHSWTAGRFTMDPWIVAFLVARVIIWGFWYPSMTSLMATNRHRKAAIVVAMSSTISVAAACLLVPRYGARGAAGAILIGEALVNSWAVPWLAHAGMREQLRATLLDAVKVLTAAIVFPATITAVAWRLLPQFKAEFLALPVFGAAMSTLIMWFLLSADERAVISQMIGPWLSRRLAV